MIKIKHISKSIRASIAFFIASLITAGSAYIFTPIYTRLLTAEEYGQVSIYLTFLQTFGIIAMFCLSYGIFNNGMIDYPDKRDEYSFSMLILSNVITLCFAGVLFCVYPIIGSYIKIEWPLLIIMSAVFLVQPAYNFWNARQRYELKYKFVLLWSAVCAVFSPLVAVILMLFFEKGERLYPRIFGAEIALILVYLCFYIYIGFKNRWKVNTHYWKKAFLFNLPLIPHYLSLYLLSSSDKFMISFLVGDDKVAYYTVAHSVASVALIIWSAINSTLIPYTYEKCKQKDYKSINKATLPLLTLFAVGCFFVIMLAPEVVKLMATNEYLEAILVIPPIVGGVFFQVQYYVYANVVYYFKRPTYVMIGSVTSVILNIILNYFCIKTWGYIAAG